MTYWRQAGLNYLQYSQIAARVLRQAIKKDVRKPVEEGTVIKITHWKDGKPIKNVVGQK